MVSATASASSISESARHQARNQACALGFHGVDGAAGEDQIHRLGLADRPRQPLRTAHARQYTQLDLGLTELGRIRGDQDVAHHRQLAAAAQRVPGDRGDGRRAGGRELRPQLEEVGRVHVGERQLGHLLDVGAGGEGLLVAGEDDGADARSHGRVRLRRWSLRS